VCESFRRGIIIQRSGQMLFNIEKCKVMHFGKKNQEYVYYMNGHKLDSVTAEKDLGIWTSHDMKASQQCIQVYSKANKLLRVLNSTIKYKDVGNLLCFYKSLIRPHLEFCIAAWSPHYVKDKVLIERIQRSFTKVYQDDTAFKEHPLRGTTYEITTVVTGRSSSEC